MTGPTMLSCGAPVRPKSDEVHGQTEFQDFLVGDDGNFFAVDF